LYVVALAVRGRPGAMCQTGTLLTGTFQADEGFSASP